MGRLEIYTSNTKRVGQAGLAYPFLTNYDDEKGKNNCNPVAADGL